MNDAATERLPRLVLVMAIIQGSTLSLSLAFHLREQMPILEPAVNAGWAMLYALSLAGLVGRFGINWISWCLRYRLLLCVILMGVTASASWSLDPWLTLERSLHLLGGVFIGLYIAFTLPTQRLLPPLALTLAVVMIGSVAAALWWPALGLENYADRTAWRGLLASKNTLGFWAAVAVMLHLVLILTDQTRTQRVLQLLALVIAVVVLSQSLSATSALSLFCGLLGMAFIAVATRFQLGFTALLVLGSFCLALGVMAGLQIDSAELIGRTRDLTGRAEVWQQTWALIADAPLTGYGYGALWYPTAASQHIQEALTDFSWVVFHAHNGFLQIASETGLPLATLTVLMVLFLFIEILQTHYRHPHSGAVYVFGFMTALVVSNYAEARLLVNRELHWILFIALPIGLLRQPVQATGIPLPETSPQAHAAVADRVRTSNGGMPTGTQACAKRSDSPVTVLPERARRKTVIVATQRRQRRQLKLRLRDRRPEQPLPGARTDNG